MPIGNSINIGLGGKGVVSDYGFFSGILFSNVTAIIDQSHVTFGFILTSQRRRFDFPDVDLSENRTGGYLGWNLSLSSITSFHGELIILSPYFDDNVDVLLDTNVRIKLKNKMSVDYGLYLYPNYDSFGIFFNVGVNFTIFEN